MNAVSQRRSDGVWYYLEVKPTETQEEKEPEQPVYVAPEDNEEDIPF